MGPSDVAKMAVSDSVKVMRSRFQSGQLSGSFGSSDGWGCYTCVYRGLSAHPPKRGCARRILLQGWWSPFSRSLLTSIMGMGPLRSHFNPLASAVSVVCGLSGSSKYLVVPVALSWHVSRGMRGGLFCLVLNQNSARTGHMLEDRVFEDTQTHDGGELGAHEGSDCIRIHIAARTKLEESERVVVRARWQRRRWNCPIPQAAPAWHQWLARTLPPCWQGGERCHW
jgi:hypothetical protein